MADTPYPLPRQTRESSINVGNGTAGPYGPSAYQIFDTIDVTVWIKEATDKFFRDVTSTSTVIKTAGAELDTFSVTFADPVLATTKWYHSARRVSNRQVAFTRAGSLDAPQAEKELSKQASAQSEIRRDLDRAVRVDPGNTAPTVEPAPDGYFSKWEGGNLVPGGTVVDIENAQENAAQTRTDRLLVEAARDLTLAALASVISPKATRALAIADNPGAAPDPEYYDVAYYDTSYRTGSGARYRKVALDPGTPDAFRNRSGVGSWYRIDEATQNPAMFGAVAGAASSQTVALQRMFTSGCKDIYLPQGTWRSDSDLTCNHDLRITGPGVLDFSNGNGQLLVAGSATLIADLSVSVAKGARQLTWAAPPAISEGQVVCLHDPRPYSWGSRRPYYRDGAFFRIHSISGSTAKLFGQAVDAYSNAIVDVYKIDSVRVNISGLRVIGSLGSAKAPIKISFGLDCSVSGLSGDGGDYALLELDRCFNSDIDASPLRNNSPVVDDEYGIILSNCHHTKIRGSGMYASRHPVALGGGDIICGVPTRDTTISDMTLFNQSNDAASADAHGNCDFTRYVNCTLLSGASIGGRNVEMTGCEVFEWQSGADGYCFWASEVVGGTYKFTNVTLRSNGIGQDFAYLYINAPGPGNGVNRPVETTMRDDLDLIIDGLTIISPNATALSKAVRVQGQNANKKLNVAVIGAGIIWKSPLGLCFVMVTDDVLAAVPSDHIIVDSVKGPAGAELLRPDATVANANVRLMPQMATVIASCASGSTSAISGVVTFRYKFPRIPQAFGVAHRSTDGLSKVAWGGKQVYSAVYALTANDVRLAALTTDVTAFTSTEDIRLSGLFGLQNV